MWLKYSPRRASIAPKRNWIFALEGCKIAFPCLSKIVARVKTNSLTPDEHEVSIRVEATRSEKRHMINHWIMNQSIFFISRLDRWTATTRMADRLMLSSYTEAMRDWFTLIATWVMIRDPPNSAREILSHQWEFHFDVKERESAASAKQKKFKEI